VRCALIPGASDGLIAVAVALEGLLKAVLKPLGLHGAQKGAGGAVVALGALGQCVAAVGWAVRHCWLELFKSGLRNLVCGLTSMARVQVSRRGRDSEVLQDRYLRRHVGQRLPEDLHESRIRGPGPDRRLTRLGHGLGDLPLSKLRDLLEDREPLDRLFARAQQPRPLFARPLFRVALSALFPPSRP
jgi:hypothetical protein